ncbi:MAG: T9SS type A sorting domain-containing protein [Saprospiraceae bacterium]
MKTIYFLLLSLISAGSLFGACELWDLQVEKTDCNPEKKFMVTINFKYKDVGECFTIKGNGKNYGNFKYNQLPVKLTLSGDCRTEYEFVIRDCHTESCRLEYFLGKECCEVDCELSEMRIEKTECDDDQNFCVFINFNHVGNSSCFKLRGNGHEYGRFSYSQLPVKICGLKANCETEYEFTAQDCENEECNLTKELGIVCCEKVCKLSELKLEKTKCDENGKFFVFINFKSTNTSDCFKVKGNGKDYGTFQYNQLPIKIGPLEGDCKTNYEFKIVDCKDERCQLTGNLGIVCCERKQCSIRDLRINKSDCDENKNFYVTINFRYSGTSSCFKVRGNGVNYGTFNYTQLPIRIGPLKGDCKTVYEFVVSDCENEACKASKSIGRVCCEEHKREELQNQDAEFQELPSQITNWNLNYSIEQPIEYQYSQTSNQFIVRFNETIHTKAYLYNAMGLIVQSVPVESTENRIEINNSNLLPGIYYLRFELEGKQTLLRFVKM